MARGNGKCKLMLEFCVIIFLLWKLEPVSRLSVVELAIGKDLFLAILARRFSKSNFEKSMICL